MQKLKSYNFNLYLNLRSYILTLFVFFNKNLYNMLNLLKNMSDKMLKFVKIGQQTPPKREVR